MGFNQKIIMEDISQLQSWLQLGTSTGFVGLAWYLIVFALPSMQERFDKHATSQLNEFREQLTSIVQRHEKAVETLTNGHERQIQIIMQIKSSHHLRDGS